MRKMFAASLVVLTATTVVAPSAASATGGADQTTLADVLLSDSARDDANGFDDRRWDYDIVTQAVLLFPDLVSAASDPGAQLTVFLPNDQAFRRLVKEITGSWPKSEADTFAAVASLGTDTVKNVLLYHIVPASISYRDALRSDGAALGTQLPGASVTVDVQGRWLKWVQLGDLDTDDRDPFVVQPNVGGHPVNGYAHGIDRVLRPIDLP
jgi:uncharacterized surface protein with fasciclin (FAS1) repeats